MHASPRQFDWISIGWLVACGLVGSALIVLGSQRTGVTFDESFYLRQGLEHWRTGSRFQLLQLGTMPLPVDIETLPVYLWEQARDRAWDLDTEFLEALALARLGNLVFYWLLLTYGGRVARGIAGPWAGRLAAFALAFEPNLLAHAGLATTDVAIAACALVFCHHYLEGRGQGWRLRIGVPALCYGLAILSKASALAFVPICMAAIEGHRLWQLSRAERFLPRLGQTLRGLLSRSFLIDSFVIGSIALAFAYVYCGSDWLPHPELIREAHTAPEGSRRDVAVWLAGHFAVFNNAGVALWFQIKHNAQGHGCYLLGEVAPRAVWYYFPVALSMKAAAPIAIAAGSLALLARRSLNNWACLAALLLLAFSVNCRVQIGVRMQLPLIALAAVGLSAAITHAVGPTVGWRRGAASAAVALGMSWLAASTGANWPDGLCYINEFWGGSEDGEQLLSDSNYDWGQGLPALDAWRREHGESEVAIWYFGTDPAASRPPFHNVPLQLLNVPNERALAKEIRTRYLAVGASILYGSYVKEPDWLLIKLRCTKPVARTRTFLIYDVQGLTADAAP